ncbi:MAG: hypothetical protein IPM35_02965 [Myxococcales bacterium]|nr:hypothetical protein [Myxococcales bacterium]
MAQLPPAALAVVAALIGGVAGGAVVRMTTRTPGPATSAAREPGAAPDTSDLEKRVAELERNSSRADRTRRIERAAAQAAPAGDEPAAAPGSGRPSIDDPVFETAVRDIIDQIAEERREERDARRTDRQKRLAESYAGELGTELGLSDVQKQKVAEVVQQYFEDLRAMRESDAGPGSRDDWRERARAERQKAEGKLAQVLDPAQMEKYKALDDDKKLGAGGGGRRGRQRN